MGNFLRDLAGGFAQNYGNAMIQGHFAEKKNMALDKRAKAMQVYRTSEREATEEFQRETQVQSAAASATAKSQAQEAIGIRQEERITAAEDRRRAAEDARVIASEKKAGATLAASGEKERVAEEKAEQKVVNKSLNNAAKTADKNIGDLAFDFDESKRVENEINHIKFIIKHGVKAKSNGDQWLELAEGEVSDPSIIESTGPINNLFKSLRDEAVEIESILTGLSIERLENFKGSTSEREMDAAFRGGASMEMNTDELLRALDKQLLATKRFQSTATTEMNQYHDDLKAVGRTTRIGKSMIGAVQEKVFGATQAAGGLSDEEESRRQELMKQIESARAAQGAQ